MEQHIHLTNNEKLTFRMEVSSARGKITLIVINGLPRRENEVWRLTNLSVRFCPHLSYSLRGDVFLFLFWVWWFERVIKIDYFFRGTLVVSQRAQCLLIVCSSLASSIAFNLIISKYYLTTYPHTAGRLRQVDGRMEWVSCPFFLFYWKWSQFCVGFNKHGKIVWNPYSQGNLNTLEEKLISN